jgi:hypothetical protein
MQPANQSVRHDASDVLARTLSARRTPHCASSVCTLSASSSMPIQRSLRISLTSSFDLRCSDETSGGFCCLRDIKTSSYFRCLLITERCDCGSALSRRYLCCPSVMPRKVKGDRPLIRQQRYAPAPPPSSRCVARVLIEQLVDLRAARLQREMMARGGVSPAQWVAMLLIALGAMTMIAVAHNHEIGLQITTLSVYAVAVSSAFFVILAHDRPFVGHLAVGPVPIEQAIERIERSFMDRSLN